MKCPCFRTSLKSIRKYYYIGDKLGAGAFGQVRTCQCITTKQEYAVKIIWKDEQGVTLEELMQEIECMRLVHFRYIVRLYDFFEDDKFLYCVMDEFSGKELFAKLKQDDLRESHFARYVKMMLSAVEYIRYAGIVHRDIKPENFLFKSNDPDSDLCMIDFGLSQIISDDEYLSVCCGTVQYLAPEQIKGRYRFDVDVWAVGVITYLLLFGRFPFSGTGDVAIMHDIIHRELVLKLSQTKKEHSNQVSYAAKDIVSNLLMKNPRERITPTDALKHPWIVMDHDVENDHMIDKNTIRMAHAVALSSRREVDPNLQDLRDVLIAEVEATEEKRVSIMSTVRKSVRQGIFSEDVQGRPSSSNVRKSLSFFAQRPSKVTTQPCFPGIVETTPEKRTSLAEHIRKSVGFPNASFTPARPKNSQILPTDGMSKVAAEFLEMRKSKFENANLDIAAHTFRRARSVGSSELASQVSQIQASLRIKSAQLPGSCWSRNQPYNLRRTESRSMTETLSEHRDRIGRQGGAAAAVINGYLPDVVRCQDPNIITTMEAMINTPKQRITASFASALDSYDMQESKDRISTITPDSPPNPRISGKMVPRRGVSLFGRPDRKSRGRATLPSQDFARNAANHDNAAKLFRIKQPETTTIIEDPSPRRIRHLTWN